MNINDLTADCLMHILAHFPLKDLIRLRSVCGHWRGLIQSRLAAKRSLKLFGSPEDIQQYCNKLVFTNQQDGSPFGPLRDIGLDDDLLIRPEFFTFEFCDLLAQLFVNIQHLVVAFPPENGLLWRRVPYLLKLWPDLGILTLHGYSDQLGIASSRIYLAIDSMFRLTNLDLSLHFTTSGSAESPVDLPQILPQLEQLSLSLFKYKGSLLSTFEQLSESNFRKLCLEWEQLTFDQFRSAFSCDINPFLPANLTHLTLRCIKGNEYIQFICGHFPSLRYLSVLFSSLTMFKFNNDLCSQLNRLRHLREFRIASIHIHVVCTPPAKGIKPESIASVRALELSSLSFSNDKDFKLKAPSFCKTLATMLPNLEYLTVRCNHQDHLEHIKERLGVFGNLKNHKIAAGYDEHKDFLGKYKHVNEDFFKRRISFE